MRKVTKILLVIGVILVIGAIFIFSFGGNRVGDECVEFDGIDKDYCYFQFAITSFNATLCEKIDTIKNKDMCYYSIALDTYDINLCENIKHDKEYSPREGFVKEWCVILANESTEMHGNLWGGLGPIVFDRD